ncbi:MAG TPA: hypothetical protein V6C58_21855 [Allocoleopsis sp.]
MPKGKFAKLQKIELNTEYPCPCKRKGHLLPMILMEAMGCDRCGQIFAVEQEGYLLEQVSSTYPYKRFWHWSGKKWMTANQNIKYAYIPILMVVTMILTIIVLGMALIPKTQTNIIMGSIMLIFMGLLTMMIVWQAYVRN